MITNLITATTGPTPPTESQALRTATDALEAGFLAEMLTAAGLGRPPSGLDGGEGESQFASMLVSAQADAMVAAGGIGLSEQLFRSISARSGGSDAAG
jgi:peptidoglycan hydrolase FlgJ